MHSLCHHADFDSKHAALLLGRRSLQAEVPTCELHRELHFDLKTNATAESGSALLRTQNSTSYFRSAASEATGSTSAYSGQERQSSRWSSYPVHLDDVHMPVLGLHRLRVQLKDRKKRPYVTDECTFVHSGQTGLARCSTAAYKTTVDAAPAHVGSCCRRAWSPLHHSNWGALAQLKASGRQSTFCPPFLGQREEAPVVHRNRAWSKALGKKRTGQRASPS